MQEEKAECEISLLFLRGHKRGLPFCAQLINDD